MNKPVLPIDHAQRILAINPKHSVLLSAPAGSGKTTVLEGRYMNCLLHANRPEDVLVITFTNAAAAEIRARICALLDDAKDTIIPLADVAPEGSRELTMHLAQKVVLRDTEMSWNIVKCPSRLKIMTFDAYCGSLADQLPLLSGQFTQGQVEEDPSLIYREAILDLFEQLENEEAELELREALKLLFAYSNFRLEDMVPYFTDLLGRRDQWLPLISSFNFEDTVKAIQKYNQASLADLAQATQFVSFKGFVAALNELSGTESKLSWAEGITTADFSTDNLAPWKQLASLVLTQAGTYRSKFTKREGFAAKTEACKLANAMLDDCKSFIPVETFVQARFLVGASALAGEKELIESVFIVLRYLVAYLQIEFKELAKKDFIEVALSAQKALGNEETGYGEAMLRQDSLSHILVDEFQDTSLSQIRLLSLLTQEWVDHNELNPNSPKTIFLCGDAQQSIYRFRGAEPGLFTEISNNKLFNNLQLEVLSLSSNFRSSKETVEFVNHVGSQVFPANGNVVTGDAAFVEACAHDQDLRGCVSFDLFDIETPEAEVQAIVERTKALLANTEDDSIAILTPARTAITEVIRGLSQAGVEVAGCDIDMIAKKESVNMVVQLVRALWHEGDSVAWVALLRSSLCGLSWADSHTLSQYMQTEHCTYRTALMSCGGISSDGVKRISLLKTALLNLDANQDLASDLVGRTLAAWKMLSGHKYLSEADVADVNRVFDALRACCKGGELIGVDHFNRKLKRLFATSDQNSRVSVMTIHKSKGLEFDHVILAGLSHAKPSGNKPLMTFLRLGDCLIPSALSRDGEAGSYELMRFIGNQQQDNELKRQFYVATTRQKSTLSLFIPVKVKDDGRFVPKSNTLISKIWPALGKYIMSANFVSLAPSPHAEESVITQDVRMVADADEMVKAMPEKMLVAERCVDDGLNHAEFSLAEQWRAVEGTVIHSLIETIVKNKIVKVDEFLTEKQKGIRALLIKKGYPVDHIGEGLANVMGDVSRVYQSDTTRKVLLDIADTGLSEQRYTRDQGAFTVNKVLDLIYVHGDTTIIIDIKSNRMNKGESITAFKSRLIKTHLEQLLSYRKIIGSIGLVTRISTYILITSLGEMIEVKSCEESLTSPSAA